MSEDRAVIRAELEGAGKVAAEAKKIGSSLKDAAKSGGAAKDNARAAGKEAASVGGQIDSLKSALSPTRLLGGVVGGLVLSTVGAAVNYMREGSAKARDWGDKTANAARRAGTDLAAFRSTVSGTERDTIQATDAQIELVNEVQRLSYGGAGAAASLRGIGAVATASGRDVREFSGVLASLQDGLGIVGDASGEVSRLIETSRRLGTIGGADALLDSVAALRSVFSQVNTEAPGAASKLEALLAVASKRLKPEQARGVVANVIGTIQARAYDIQRATGIDPLDERGNVRDPIATMRMLRDRALKQNGGDKRLATMGLTKTFDARAARFLMDDPFGEIEAESKKTDKSQAEEGLKAFLRTPEGARQAREVRSEQRQRAAGEYALKAEDAYGEGKEAAIGALSDSFSSGGGQQSTAAPQPMGDALTPDLSRLGSGERGGQIKIEFPPNMARDIGQAVAEAQKLNPPILRMPVNPNDGKVQ